MATVPYNGFGEAAGAREHRTIPFDYAFRFDAANKKQLKGIPGTVHNDTVTVSIEATFVAVSIGFGVIPSITPVPVPAAQLKVPVAIPSGATSLLDSMRFLDSLATVFNEGVPSATKVVGPQTAAALQAGIRLNPDVADAVLSQDVTQPLTLSQVFQVISPGNADVQFKYAIFDEGSGREFQSEPILSTAGLGISDGERPFRYFARPIEFRPRSTIRMQITEVSDFQGDLHISLQGYKVLGGAGTPTGRARQHIGAGRRR